MHRFFVPAAEATGSIVAVPPDEAAHLTRVLRLKAGDAVRVFDGRGHEWQAEVSVIEKGAASVRLGAPVEPAREAAVDVALAAAILKGDKMDDVVRDAVMLGVTSILPLITARTEIPSHTVWQRGRVARWQRIALSSAKQCGRAVVPPVGEVIDIQELVEAPSSSERVMLVEPGAGGKSQALRNMPRANTVTLVVGPEGGWDPQEIATASAAGIVLATLGQQTLRADAVPLVALTALRVLWGDL